MSEPQLRQVAPRVHAWIGAGGDSNAGAVETPHGLIIIDTQQSCALAKRFRDTLRASVAAPIRTVVNTHYHLDHIAGNVVFSDAPIIAHDRTLQALEREAGPLTVDGRTVTDTSSKIRMFFGANFDELVPPSEQAWFVQRVGGAAPLTIKPPSETFADRMEFGIPDEIVRLEYWGPAHCDGDIVIHLQESGVIFLGDLLFYGRFPWFGDCDLDGWIATLDRVLTMDVKTVVPGHGAPATLKEVAQFRALLHSLRSAVSRALKSGASEDAAVHAVHLPEYAALPRYKEWLPFNVRSTYRYLGGVRR
jgi:glyoxylase-like metal-dependent hydrolase (beta-lactamase superfamily II)